MPREFTHRYDEAFVNGLRRNDRELVGAQAFATLFNAYPTNFGLGRLDQIAGTAPFTTPTITPAFPFPQLFRNRRRELVVEAAAVHRIDATTPGTGVTFLLVQSGDGSTADTITGSALWHHASIGDTWIITNGSTIVYESAWREGADLGGNGLAVIKTTTASSVASNGLRLFAGGMKSAGWFAAARFVSIFDAWKKYQDLNGRATYLDENVSVEAAIDEVLRQGIFYSTSVGGSKTWPFYYFIAMLNGHTDANFDKIQGDLLGQVRRGELGILMLETQGPVHVLKQLGSDIIAYTADGIISVNSGLVQGRVVEVGIPSRTAVGGDDQEHIAIGSDGTLWRLRAGEAPERLGYDEFLSTLTLATTSIVFNPLKRDYYISDGTNSFILSSTGLAKIDTFPTGLFPNKVTAEDVLEGWAVSGGDATFDCISHPFDLGFAGLKTVTGVQLGFRNMTAVKVAISYRNDVTGAWAQTPLIPVNDEGVAYPHITAREFRLIVDASMSDGAKLEYADVKWQSSDIRAQRGTREAT